MEKLDLSPAKTDGIDFAAVRQYHQARETKLRTRCEEERLVWLARGQQAINHFAPTHVALQRVYLFGSVMQPGRFRPDSDIDVAVECTNLETESLFWSELERELQRDVDVRLYVGAIIDAVRWHGKLVYERESHHSK
ncbi:MAG: nucleotidyltransferase domain-containing protein [Caldilineaceae bacterium]